MPTELSIRPRWIESDLSTARTNQWLPDEPAEISGSGVLGEVVRGNASKTSMPERSVSSDLASQGSGGSRAKPRPGRGGSRSPPVVRVHSPDHMKVRVSKQMNSLLSNTFSSFFFSRKNGQLTVRNNGTLDFECL